MHTASKPMAKNEMQSDCIEIFLAEDHDIVREGIISLLQSEKEIKVIGEASNGNEAIEKIQKNKPHVVLMDLDMPGMNGFECTVALKKKYRDVKVLILSMHDNEKYLIDVLAVGADGYILKNAHKDDLIFAIKKVVNDGIFISPEFTLSMISKFRRYHQAGCYDSYDITEREMEVLRLIGEGMTNAEIANKLFTSIRTIETRRKNLLEKTKTNNTATLIRFAVKYGLLN